MRTLPLRTWLILGVIVFTVVMTLAYCHARDQAKQARAGEIVAEGRTVSAVEAIEKIDALGERANATDAEVAQAKENVRNASPENRADAFRYNACVLQHRTDCDGLLRTR